MNLSTFQQIRFNRSAKAVRKASILLVIVIAASLGHFALIRVGIRINISGSMPRGLYHVRALSRTVRRGDIVAVCLPLDEASLGRARGYVGPGICPGGVDPLLKIVVAAGDDTVVASEIGVTVNGQLLPESGRLQVDVAGRYLLYRSTQTYRMPLGTIWLYAPSERSWDSRYWGPVQVGSVIGFADPLITF
jgi:conjugative transfer signal peptidase TraF